MPRKLRNARRSGFLKPKKFFIIATEGALTEKIYFDEFKPPREAAFQVKVLENRKHKTRPKQVFKRLVSYSGEFALAPDDELWLVIDRDSWTQDELDEVAQLIAERNNFYLALSNPCFELWLFLHFAENKPFNYRHQIPPELKRLIGAFEKGDYDASKCVQLVRKAIERANALDLRPGDPWPTKQGSRVYRLMKKLT
jgi:hypothetical protein